MFRHGARRLELIHFEENTAISIPLPRDRLIKKIELWLDGIIVSVDPGAGVAGTAREDAVSRIVPLIEVIGDGMVVLKRYDARGLYYLNYRDAGCPPFTLAPTTGAGNIPIQLCLTIQFQNNLGIRPADTFLLAPAFRSLNLVIHWGSLADMFSTDRTFTQTMTTAYGFRPVIYETTEPKPIMLRIEDYIDKEVTATRTDFPIDLTVGNRTYQNFMWMSTDAEATKGQTRSDAIINFINVVTGENFRHFQEIPWDQLQVINEKDFSFEAIPAGIGNLYLLEEGRVPSGLNVNDLNTAKVIMDVTVGAVTPTFIRQYNDIITPL
jgi:hypothetical protein